MRVRNLNAGAYNADGTVNINNFTATGPFYVYQEPVGLRDIASKNYVDQQTATFNTAYITTGTLSRDRLPAFTGQLSKSAGNAPVQINVGNTAAAGTYASVTVGAHGFVTAAGPLSSVDVPSFAWSKITSGKPTTVAGWGITDALLKSGGTVSGPVSITGGSIDYSNVLHGVTKSYVDTAIAGMAAGTVSYKTGEFRLLPNSSTPSGYLRCNGAAVSKTTYAALYAVVGDVYGYELTPGAGRPWQQQYDINTGQTGDITGWVAGTSLPTALIHSQAIVTKNRVYILGGYNATSFTSAVYTAPINADGTLGSWTTGTSLPGNLAFSHAVVTKNRVHLICGYNATSFTSAVYTAPINADGTLGSWTTGTSLPYAVVNGQAIVTVGRVYLLGGRMSADYFSTVYTAPINADGTLGSWTTGTSLPGPLAHSHAVVTKNRVYLLGGHNGAAYVSTVYTAPINADGTLGSWTTGTSLPGNLAFSQAIITSSKVYLLGGFSPSGYMSTVYTAPINADGTLGSWTTGTSLPVEHSDSHAVVTKNRVYLLGGHNGAASLSTVYTAPISGGLNDYSPYYDGTVTATASTDFKLPDITANEAIGLYTYIKT